MKTWFITGASRGFGLRIAKLALEQGDNVVATARRAEAVIEALGQRDRLLALPLDVTDEAQARAAAAVAVEAFGSIDVLLNNAGFGLLGAVEEASAADVEAVYRTNVFGLLNVTRAVLPVIRPFNARMKTRLIPSVHKIYADGDTVIAHFDAQGMARDGQPYVNSYAWILTLKDGRIARAFAFFDAKAFDDFWTRVQPAP